MSFSAAIEPEGLSMKDEAVRLYAEKHLGGAFAVSSAVVHKRIELQGLWP